MFFSTASYAYPPFLPAFVDWRHSVGRGDSFEPEFDIEKVRTVTMNKLRGQKRKQAVAAHSKRMPYVAKFKRFREHVLDQMNQFDIPRPGVELLGSELEPKKDLIYVDYKLDGRVRGKYGQIQQFVVDTFKAVGLDDHFHSDPVGSRSLEDNNAADQKRSEIVWVFARYDNPHDELKDKHIDYWNVSDPEGEEPPE